MYTHSIQIVYVNPSAGSVSVYAYVPVDELVNAVASATTVPPVSSLWIPNAPVGSDKRTVVAFVRTLATL